MLDFQIDQQFMQTHTLSFRTPIDDPKTYYLVEDAMLEFEDEFYFIDSIQVSREGNESYLGVVANALWYRLGERKYLGQFVMSEKTPAQGLAEILAAAQVEGLPWSSGITTADPLTYSMDTRDSTFLDLIFQWAKITSNEVGFNTKAKKVHLRETIGGNYGLSFRYQRNLTSISREVVPPQVTRLYGYGRLDLSIAGVNPSGEEYIEDYSFYTDQGLDLATAQALYRKDETYKDDSFIDDESLYAAMLRRLEALSQPTVSYAASVVDLSRVTGYAEASFGMGDSVVVEDEPLGISVITRVVRFVRFPYEPERNQVELSFIPVTLPDSNVSTERDQQLSWELFEHRNELTPRQIRSGSTILHNIPLRAQQDADWTLGFSLQGVAVGASTVTFAPVDLVSGAEWHPSFTRSYVDGQKVEINFGFGRTDVASGRYIHALRAYSDTAGAGIDIAQYGTSLWMMVRGAVRETLQADNSVTYSYTGAIQSFTVPDDVYQIRVEANGSAGGSPDGTSTTYGGRGKGSTVAATFYVVPGTAYDVYVGGLAAATQRLGGWPNGGDGDLISGFSAGGGGGATFLVATGLTIADAIIVAAGGGGQGDHAIPAIDVGGGNGGYLLGGDGRGNANLTDTNPNAFGATQSAPGLGGFNYGGGPGPWSRTGETGDTDGLGQGGDAADSTGIAYAGGGGGGGWHGGGGAGSMSGGGDKAGGGGGGSGYSDPSAEDLEYEDGAWDNHQGQMTISWDDPTD